MLSHPRKVLYFIELIILIIILALKPADLTDWAAYLGGSDRNHYSTLTQIKADNVDQLKVAWEYNLPDSGQMQVNPLIIQGVLYGVSSTVQAFALDASTGKEIWRFGDPLKNWASTSRGVSFWTNGIEKRILYTAGPNLWALDAQTGKPILSFGEQGKIDLHLGLPAIASSKFIISNTPGTIYHNLIIMPVRLSEGADAAPGDIRAFDILTGKLVWTFHTIPYPGEKGYTTWPKDAYLNTHTGAANNWAGMAVDNERGILFVPTGSAGYDFYGGNRKGANLFANCLIALDAKTGKRLWHFQTTHHDLWDRDLPAPPNLITVTHRGKKIPAVAQITKQGFVFLFDRVSGKPLFPIVEKKVMGSALKGEKAWLTQPYPTLPKPYARLSSEIQHNDINPYSENKEELINTLASLNKSWHAAPSEKGNLILPGFDGGGEWGGAAADPNGILYVNSNEMAWIQKMVPTKKSSLNPGEKIYQTNCQSCHGADKKGNPFSGYPTLVGISSKKSKTYIQQIINNGKGMMPGFNHLSKEEKDHILSFINDELPKEVASKTSNSYVSPYQMTGYIKFLDAKGLPALSPPWGTLNAIDLNTGKYAWKIPFGDEPALAKQGITGTGAENYGGPIVTASGLLIIGAAKDGKLRIYASKTGKLLRTITLPAAAFATPSTYAVNGKQFIVIACGGTKLGTPKGNKYIAFSL
ncbi:outer membrane protein assembly factor BamB family protein [Aquirufa antheringensis]